MYYLVSFISMDLDEIERLTVELNYATKSMDVSAYWNYCNTIV